MNLWDIFCFISLWYSCNNLMNIMDRGHFPDRLKGESIHYISIGIHFLLFIFPPSFLLHTFSLTLWLIPQLIKNVNCFGKKICIRTLSPLTNKAYSSAYLHLFHTFLIININMLNSNAPPAKKVGFTLCASVIPHPWSEEIKCIHLIVLFYESPSPNPRGPLQHKQNQTEEFSSQHVILHGALTHRNKFGTTLQQSQSPWIKICLGFAYPYAYLRGFFLSKWLCL